jgi:LDH2 family malate/lactate/ureidoglycolate dehydrogenase
MSQEKAYLFSEKDLRDFCRRSFEKSGLSREDAELVTDTLVQAEMRGVDTHGIVRLPFYCKRLIDGGSRANPEIKVLTERPSILLIDGDNGLGQVISVWAMKKAIEKARSSGICFAAVRNSCHFGMAAYYAMMALSEDMVGVAASNAPPVMAAWGGRTAAIGNNPLAIAVPADKSFPLVLDMAMSVAAGGKVRLAALNKEKIPFGWILDAQGRPTDNPADFFPGGTLLPLGHKGFGLAVMIEVLSGVLSGAGILGEMGLWFRDTAVPINNGHFFMALDIRPFCDLNGFKGRVEKMIDELKSSPLAEGSTGIFMPGEIEFLKEEASRRDGISVSKEVIQHLNRFALEIGIDPLNVESGGEAVK